MSLTIRYDPASPIPAVHQIAGNLRVLLVEGGLTPGEKLPSVRRVAIELGVHFNTVAEAYRLLAEEGWLQLRQGRAALVLARASPSSKSAPRMTTFRDRLKSLVAQMRAEGAAREDLALELRAMAKAVRQS